MEIFFLLRRGLLFFLSLFTKLKKILSSSIVENIKIHTYETGKKWLLSDKPVFEINQSIKPNSGIKILWNLKNVKFFFIKAIRRLKFKKQTPYKKFGELILLITRHFSPFYSIGERGIFHVHNFLHVSLHVTSKKIFISKDISKEIWWKREWF